VDKFALELATTQWQKLTDELGRANQVKQWKTLKESYPQALKEILK
jgi:hypothetical protein